MLKSNILRIITALTVFSSLQAKEMKDYLPAHPLIFDVGAHIGNKTAHYLELGADLVVCFEPQPAILETLRNRYAGNPKVVILPLGVSDKSGMLTFYPYYNGTIATVEPDWMQSRFSDATWEAPIQISTTTLDAAIQIYGVPDFCKIDVEGHEWSVLMGLKSAIPYLNFEFIYEYLDKKTKPCLNRLIELGYRKFNVVLGGENEIFHFGNWVDVETLFSFLKSRREGAWGDIYAKYD